jgi:hypothetical protein
MATHCPGIAFVYFETHNCCNASAAKMMELTKRIDAESNCLGRRSSTTTDRYLKSNNRERLAYARAVGEQLFKQVTSWLTVFGPCQEHLNGRAQHTSGAAEAP